MARQSFIYQPFDRGVNNNVNDKFYVYVITIIYYIIAVCARMLILDNTYCGKVENGVSLYNESLQILKAGFYIDYHYLSLQNTHVRM